MNVSSRTITKKAWPEYFQAIVDGHKTFDLRLNDFDAQVGDTLVLQEWDPQTQTYTGREIRKEISHVLKTKDLTFFSEQETHEHGFLIMSLT